MTKPKNKEIEKFHVRAALPRFIGYGALGLILITLIATIIGFYRTSNNPEFRMQGFPTTLSNDVTAEIVGYERRELDGDRIGYIVRADKAISYADNHQELHNAFFEIFDETGTASDRLTAQKAIYVPAENKDFTAYLSGSVGIETRDALRVKTEQITYRKATETAIADEFVEFDREGIRGKSFGAEVKVKEKRVELKRDVEIETFDSPEFSNQNLRNGHMSASHASYDQVSELVELTGNVLISTQSESNGQRRLIDARAEKGVAILDRGEKKNRSVKKAELFDNVRIESREGQTNPTIITAGYAMYDSGADRFELKNGLKIVTTKEATVTNISSNSGIYEQSNNKVALTGSSEITQGESLVSGDRIDADLFPDKSVKNAKVTGNALVKQTTVERSTVISGQEVSAMFASDQTIQNAKVIGAGRADVTPAKAEDFSKLDLSAQKGIDVSFKSGLVSSITTDGRTTIKLNAPNATRDAANKELTADSVRTFFSETGKATLSRAEAVGNAELIVVPLNPGPDAYKTTVTAARFDCDFYTATNNAKTCEATSRTRSVRVPTQPTADRGNQVMTADSLKASFSQQSSDVENFDAIGKAKFTELDRNALADTFSFNALDGVIRFRGGEPTIWDSKARAKAKEIDWDTRSDKSLLRGGVSTTYYSQADTGGATPFGKSDKPVFVTSGSAEFDHNSEVGVYSGNARGWQGDNYLRADRLILRQQQGQLRAEGNVQSLLSDVKRKENAQVSTQAVSASSDDLDYSHKDRLMVYQRNVDIRQGKDRIVGGVARITLNENSEISKTEVESNVVITQPNRRASGEYARYTSADEVVTLRGNPASVDDGENGRSQGSEMVVYLRENRVVSEGKSKQNTGGRIRSVFKVKSN